MDDEDGASQYVPAVTVKEILVVVVLIASVVLGSSLPQPETSFHVVAAALVVEQGLATGVESEIGFRWIYDLLYLDHVAK